MQDRRPAKKSTACSEQQSRPPCEIDAFALGRLIFYGTFATVAALTDETGEEPNVNARKPDVNARNSTIEGKMKLTWPIVRFPCFNACRLTLFLCCIEAAKAA